MDKLGATGAPTRVGAARSFRTGLDRVVGQCLRRFPPELAHRLGLRGARLAAALHHAKPDPALLATEAFGLHFPNPVGLAAGLDKDAEAFRAFLQLGFGFVEVGTVTPRPQAGNRRPRLFRLPDNSAVINRYGFNNAGMEVLARRLRGGRHGLVGINLGANKDSADRTGDYIAGLGRLGPLADYVTINVSSPNTEGLRQLQHAEALDDLLARCIEARESLGVEGRRPILLKIAPDLSLQELDTLIGIARDRRIDGLIVANTTTSRPLVRSERHAEEAGGLSGAPLFPLSTRLLAEAFVRAEGAFPLIGVGGVDSGDAAWEKIRAGATLVQLYTGLVYKGLGLLGTIKDELAQRLAAGGFQTVAAAVGGDARDRLRRPWPA